MAFHILIAFIWRNSPLSSKLCMWFWLSDRLFLMARFEYPPKWCTCSAVWLLHGWCHVKLLPSRRVLCKPCTMPRHFMQSHIRHTCLAVTRHLHFWHNDLDRLRVTAVTRGWNGHRNKSQHRKLTTEKINSPAAPVGPSNPRPFDHESGALTTEPGCRVYTERAGNSFAWQQKEFRVATKRAL